MNPILRFSFLNYMELSDSLSWRGFLKALLISPINQIVKHISFFCHCSIVYVWLATGLACLYLISSFMHNSHSVLRSLWTLLVFLKNHQFILNSSDYPKTFKNYKNFLDIYFHKNNLCYLCYESHKFGNLCLNMNL